MSVLFTIIKIKGDDGYDILINTCNVTCVARYYTGEGYVIHFVDGTERRISWKEYDRLNSALETIADNE